jgi:hypothetical protein
VIRSGGRAPVTIAALPRKSVNREDTMAQQLALLNAFDEPASTNRLRDSPAIYRRRKQGDGRVPEPFDTQPKARKRIVSC